MFYGKLLSHEVWSARVLCFQKWSIGIVFLSCLCPANDSSFELQGWELCFPHWEGERWYDAVCDACPGASTKALLYYYASVPQENMADELLLPLTPY